MTDRESDKSSMIKSIKVKRLASCRIFMCSHLDEMECCSRTSNGTSLSRFGLTPIRITAFTHSNQGC